MVAHLARFELTAPRLGGACSILLSYRCQPLFLTGLVYANHGNPVFAAIIANLRRIVNSDDRAMQNSGKTHRAAIYGVFLYFDMNWNFVSQRIHMRDNTYHAMAAAHCMQHLHSVLNRVAV